MANVHGIHAVVVAFVSTRSSYRQCIVGVSLPHQPLQNPPFRWSFSQASTFYLTTVIVDFMLFDGEIDAVGDATHAILGQ